jgi:hypothetical protein
VSGLALALVAAWLVWALPDRTGWIGDFVVRRATLERADGSSAAWFPQASRLDLALHHFGTRALAARLGWAAGDAARLVGALEAFLLGALAVGFARATGATGAGALVAAFGALFTTSLGLFTGYSKSFTEVVLATVLLCAGALAMLRGRRGDPWVALGVALAVFAHRSGFALVPAALVVWVLAGWRRPSRWREPWVLASLLVVVAALALAASAAWTTFQRIDVAAHLTPHEPGTGGAWWKGVFAGTRPFDLAAIVLGLPTLLLAALAPARTLARDSSQRAPLVFFGVLAASWLAGLLAVHPAQGFVRDVDDVAAFVMALGLAAAWVLGMRLSNGAGRALASPIAATVIAGTIWWLMVPADPAAGLARVHAFVTEPPARAPDELAASWGFLGVRATNEQRWADAAEALAGAARYAPAPTTMREWALAEIQSGRPDHAIAIYRALLGRDPNNVMAWYSLAAVSTQVGDYSGAAEALRSLLAIAPADSSARANLALIEQVHPETRRPPPR